MIETIGHVAPTLQATLLLIAGWNDLLVRRIPDRICIALAAAGVLARAVAGTDALAASAAAAALLFALMVPLHALGGLGGGDIKLSTALVLGLSLADAYHFLIMTTVSGGMLALVHLSLRLLPSPTRCPAGAPLPHRLWMAERRRARRPASLPYGVAIAAGGIAVIASGSVG